MAKNIIKQVSVMKERVNINMEKGQSTKKSIFQIDFLNIDCDTSRVHQLKHDLPNHNVSIFGMVSTLNKKIDPLTLTMHRYGSVNTGYHVRIMSTGLCINQNFLSLTITFLIVKTITF